MNVCTFSPDRLHRYTLEHEWDEISPSRRIMWIGLNPSTADEQRLDPTLRRIRDFSKQWGYTSFVMTNLFAYRATKPKDMLAAADPIGRINDVMLCSQARSCETVVFCWGSHGTFLKRGEQVSKLLRRHLQGKAFYCLGLTQNKQPKHPLYLPANTVLEEVK